MGRTMNEYAEELEYWNRIGEERPLTAVEESRVKFLQIELSYADDAFDPYAFAYTWED